MLRKHKWLPNRLLLRLSLLNILIVAGTILLSGWALYHTACFLAEGIGKLSGERQQRFNATLLRYLWAVGVVGLVSGSVLHFYLARRLMRPIQRLTKATKQLKQGTFPAPIEVQTADEIGQLTAQYNELIAQLQANEKNRRKLVSDLSHEIRTPLTNLNGYLLALQNGDIASGQEIFTSLYQESCRLTQLVESIEKIKEWDYVTSQTLFSKQLLDIDVHIRQCIVMFEWVLQERNLRIESEIAGARVPANLAGLQQVMRNLIDNAIRYYDGEGAILITGKWAGDFYRIVVCGPGMPISMQQQAQIFERFYRIEPSRSRVHGGTGLGLAIAKEIVERHGGEIGVISEGGMNCFWFTLPMK